MQYRARQWPDIIQYIEVIACPKTIRADTCKIPVVGSRSNSVNHLASQLDMGLITGIEIVVKFPTYITLYLDQEIPVGTLKYHQKGAA